MIKRGELFPSRFLKTKEKDGITAVFNSLRPQPIFLKNEEWKKFIKNMDDLEIIELLVSMKLLITDKGRDEAELENIRTEYENRNKRVATLYLVLTHRCNFRCKYCFEVNFEDEKYKGGMMSDKTIKKGIDLFAEQFNASYPANERCLIILYGGEPMMNRRGVYYAIDHITSLREQGILPKEKTELVIITNGSLIRERDAMFFKEKEVATLVSLDSPDEKINDLCRINREGNGTAKHTLDTIEMLKNIGVDIGISVTITPYNVDSLGDFPGWL